MMRIQALMCCLAAGVLALGQVPTDLLLQYPVPNLFVSGGKAVYVLPPRQVFFGSVSPVEVRDDSQYLAFIGDQDGNQSIPDPSPYRGYTFNVGPQKALYLLNLASGETVRLAGLPDSDNFVISDLHWLTGSKELYLSGYKNEDAFAILYEPESKRLVDIRMADAPAKNILPLLVAGQDAVVFFEPIGGKGGTTQLSIYSIAGRTWKTVQLDANGASFYSDGQHIYSVAYDREIDDIRAIQEFDVASGRLGPVVHPMHEVQKYPPYNVWVDKGNVIIGEGWDGQQFSKTEGRPANIPVRIPAEAFWAGCTNDGRFAYSVDRSGLNLIPLKALTDAEFEALFRDNVRNQAMRRAKQVATAMMIYGSDYDDLLPPVDDWQSRIDPYMKNRELANGFVYLLNGDDLSKISDPSNTTLGVVDTPFGSATVRADGSVVWKDRPKTATLRSIGQD
ncbi:MAG: hypothetical protein KF743_03070 [Fimbriimonadaceae bacterium]|nr:hypothetical protein [Fimbriimonadaceae bacterium]